MLKTDIQSYLVGRPVMARPPTLRYRCLKFVRRHRTLVVASAMVFLSLFAGLIASTYLYLESLQHKRELLATNRQLADRNQNYRDLSRLMFETIDAAGPSYAGAETPLYDWLQNAAPYIDKLGEHDPYLHARVQYRYGKTTLALGQYHRACQHLNRSLQFFMAQAGPTDPESQIVWWRWCEYLIAIGDYPRAEEELLALLALLPQDGAGHAPVFFRARFSLARAMHAQARLEESAWYYADTIQRQWASDQVDDSFAIGLRGFANVLIESNQPIAAENYLMSAQHLLVAQFGPNHAQIMENQFSYAWLRKRQARYDEAYELYCHYYGEAARRFGLGSVEAIKALQGMAFSQQGIGLMEGAHADAEQALTYRLQRATTGEDRLLLSLMYQWSYYDQSPASLAFMQHLWHQVLLDNPKRFQAEQLELGNNLADRLLRANQPEAALDVQRVALALYREEIGESGGELSVFYCTLAEIEWRLGFIEAAEQNFLRAIGVAEKQRHRYLNHYWAFLGLLLCEQGRYAEGLPKLEQAWRGLRTQNPRLATAFAQNWQYYLAMQARQSGPVSVEP